MKNKIIEESLSWIGTRFKHQGRLKKDINSLGGCDCLGLVVGVARNLKIKTITGNSFESFDQVNYSKLVTSNILLNQLNLLLSKVNMEDLQLGDIILIKVNDWPQHLAIISSISPSITIIHSYIQVRRVVKQNLPQEWLEKIVAIYRFQ